VLETCRGMK